VQWGEQLAVLKGHRDDVGCTCVAFSTDGQLIASGSHDRTICVCSAQTGDRLAVLEGHIDKVYFVAFSPNGQKLAPSSKDSTVHVWNAQTSDQLLVNELTTLHFVGRGVEATVCGAHHMPRLVSFYTVELRLSTSELLMCVR
jgi:WD40 repeat protein